MPELLEGLPLPGGLDLGAIKAAASTVRDYCDWHIAPVVIDTVTVEVSRGDQHGVAVAMLPTLRLLKVMSVDGATTGFTWTRTGKLILTSASTRFPVTVVFSHGYDTCPPSVAAAVFQLAARGLVPAPQLKSDTGGPYGASWYEQSNPLDSVSTYRRVGVA